jgi:hypothetical protein
MQRMILLAALAAGLGMAGADAALAREKPMRATVVCAR